jgi:enediyne biosynthesis protein E4
VPEALISLAFPLRAAALALLLAFAEPLTDLSAASKIVAKLENSAGPQKHLIETMVGGVALLDFDRDGKLDAFLCNGAEQPSLAKTSPRYWNRLYRGVGNGQFEDVTTKAGLQGQGYDIGVAAADYDNDGWTDLFVAGVKGNTLYRNRGDGTFEDQTTAAGLATKSPRWAVGAAWFDMDQDGDLDLFVVNYVQWNPLTEPSCGNSVPTYCHPRDYAPQPNTLYRNEANGKFTDVSRESGIAAHPGKGMGVAVGDIDQDGRLDLFVTNDTEPNFLFHNQGDGRFTEIAGPAGVALNDDGRALSSMGTDWRDWDNDGREDLFVTALTNETFPLFRNLGKLQFADRTYPSLVGKETLARSGWSAGIYDFDNDGFKDLFAACADVQDNTEKYSGRASRQSNLILRNRGNGTFTPLPLSSPALHRGAAFGDLDGDGAIDAVVTRIGQSPLILRNSMAQGQHWIGVRLQGKTSNRQGLGALVKVTSASGKPQWNRITSAVGYASSSEPVAHFGLGQEAAIASIEIRWPNGQTQTIEAPASDRYLVITEPSRDLAAWNAPWAASPRR